MAHFPPSSTTFGIIQNLYNHWFPSDTIFVPLTSPFQGYLEMSEYVFDCHIWECYWHVMDRGHIC